MKTLLIKPNTKQKQYGEVEPLSAIEMPLWLLLMANCFDDPSILDAEAENYTRDKVVYHVLKENPENVVILATGSHPSAHIQQSDEAEFLSKEIRSAGFGGGIAVYNRLCFDPITVGKPQWDLLPIQKYRAHNWHCWGGKQRTPYGSVFTSVSCPYSCEFCCIKSFYNTKYNVRPVEDVLKDFHDLYDKGVRNFKIMDELFVTKNPRLFKIAEGMRDIGKDINIWTYARIDTVNPVILRTLRMMGVTWVAYGIESGNDAIRSGMMKGKFNKRDIIDAVRMTEDANINVLGNYMFGFWEDTMSTMQETLDFAKLLNTPYANFYCTVAYPESKLYEDMKSRGVNVQDDTNDYAQTSPTFKPLPTKEVSAKDVLTFRDNAFKEYFTDSRYQSSIKERFGNVAIEEINDMLSKEIIRV